MDLFGNNPAENLLPYDGTVNYYGTIFSPDESRRYYRALLDGVPWKNDEAIIFGKHIVTAREAAWYGDADYFYTYSGTTRRALPWNGELRTLRAIVEKRSGEKFNSCLLNLYHDGSEGMAWHSDDERSLGRDSAIASLSFGAERKFCFKHRQTAQAVSLVLGDGSLLVMRGTTQAHWLHCLPKSKTIRTPRINLTFRSMVTV